MWRRAFSSLRLVRPLRAAPATGGTREARGLRRLLSVSSVRLASRSSLLAVSAGVLVGATVVGVAGGVALTAGSNEGVQQQLLQKADALYEGNEMRAALELLEPHATEEDAQVLWRLARVCYKVGKYHSHNHEESKQLSEKGMKFAERSVLADEGEFNCHKWMGIILSWSSEFYGYKRKIERSYDIRTHFERAIELNPGDPTCKHLLGQWCFAVCSVPWYQRQFASIVFATPPNATYEEALLHFQEAENTEPGFYKVNWLWLGKTQLALGNREDARKWLEKAAELTSKFGDDLEAKKEAAELLRSM